jgi:hypothetical protein
MQRQNRFAIHSLMVEATLVALNLDGTIAVANTRLRA